VNVPRDEEFVHLTAAVGLSEGHLFDDHARSLASVAFAASLKSLERRGVRAARPLLCTSSIDLSHTIGFMLFRSLFLVACFTVRIVAGAQEIQVVNAGIPGENSADSR
jgi:hypothetical protein